MLETVNFKGEKLADSTLISKLEEIKGDLVGDLDLSDNYISEDGALEALKKFSGAVQLGLANNNISTLFKLGGLMKSSLVKEIALGGNPITAEEVAKFIEEVKISKLKKIGLAGLGLSDAGVKVVIYAVKDMGSLTHLDLSYNDISNYGLEVICNLGFTGEALLLAANDISNLGLSSLVDNLDNFPNLKMIDLRGNEFMGTDDFKTSLQTLKSRGIELVLDSQSGISGQFKALLMMLGLPLKFETVVSKDAQMHYPLNSS